ncbi:MAG: hypothetical protein R3280_04310 [Marinobacter sp.]|uniref:hypothetical protein n=1 Tax=Marinobacter sp. TaxID=50741 RepID=UPI00299F1073|nr:hypothetical protein [Marinobacter sp.]MDX1633834.1 hypothetical protein [Marinobacter sp.]
MNVKRSPIRRLCHGVLIAASLWATQAQALAPEHETRRLMIATEQAIKEQRWGDAGQFLNRLQGLDSEKPPAYLYYRGRVMLQSGLLTEAREALEGYIQSAGAEGEFYTDALELITEVEQQQKTASERAPTQPAGSEQVAVIEPANSDSLSRLRQLYLADSDAEALVIHTNTLLELAGWHKDQRIVRAGALPDILYRVSAENGQINIQESRLVEGENARRRLSVQTMSVYGVNPNVRWECPGVDPTCWIYDPRDGSRLLKLAADRERVAELARTLGQLIRTLQAPS